MNVTVAGYQAVTIMHGGPNTQIRNTAKHLSRHGIRVTFFDPWDKFQREKCDLVHLFAANLGTYHLAREIKSTGVPLAVSPIIYSRHSHQFVRTALRIGRVIGRVGPGLWSDYQFASDICGWASTVLPNSRAEASLVSKGLGTSESRITVIPNGVEKRFGDGDPKLFRRKFGVDRFILNVGHIGHGRKNVLRLIKALAGIDYPAVIIGRIIRGPYGDACVREASKYKHIHLIDGLDNSSPLLASAYAACEVFALPSQFETPGIAALEAGLAGARIVITKYGGTEEYFGSMATYVEPDSIDSIRHGIVEALGHPATQELREHIREHYLWDRVAELTAAAYHEVHAQINA